MPSIFKYFYFYKIKFININIIILKHYNYCDKSQFYRIDKSIQTSWISIKQMSRLFTIIIMYQTEIK